MGRKRRGGFCAGKILGGSSSNSAVADSSPPYHYRGDLGMGSYYCSWVYEDYINCIEKGGSLLFCDSFESYVKTWCPVKG